MFECMNVRAYEPANSHRNAACSQQAHEQYFIPWIDSPQAAMKDESTNLYPERRQQIG